MLIVADLDQWVSACARTSFSDDGHIMNSRLDHSTLTRCSDLFLFVEVPAWDNGRNKLPKVGTNINRGRRKRDPKVDGTNDFRHKPARHNCASHNRSQ